MKITKAKLRQIIKEEMSRMDNDLDTDHDGEISVGELEAEIEDIKDDLEAAASIRNDQEHKGAIGNIEEPSRSEEGRFPP